MSKIFNFDKMPLNLDEIFKTPIFVIQNFMQYIILRNEGFL